jgi:hypothetical protein
MLQSIYADRLDLREVRGGVTDAGDGLWQLHLPEIVTVALVTVGQNSHRNRPNSTTST